MGRFGRLAAAPAPREAYALHARTDRHRRLVDGARAALADAARRGPLVASSSWGKDSSALCDLACEVLGRPTILHLASSYRLPGWEPVAAHFAARADVVELAPRRTLAETIAWLREVGLGYERATATRRTATNRAKRDAGAAWCATTGFVGQALGLRADESVVRRRLLRARGLVYVLASGEVRCCPLGWWTARDVWAYILDRGVPYHPLYDHETHGQTRETLRNTGWLTTIDATEGRIAWLRAHYPEQYRALVAEFPRVAQLA